MATRISHQMSTSPRLRCPTYPLSDVNPEECPTAWWFFWYECCGFNRTQCCLRYEDWFQYTLFFFFFCIALALIFSAYRCYRYLKQKTKWISPEEDEKAHVNYRAVTQERRASRGSSRHEFEGVSRLSTY